MSTQLLAVTSALLLGIISSHTYAAQTWTITTKGTIRVGVDVTGVFGMAGQDLAGKSFSQTITTSTDPAQWTFGDLGFEAFFNNQNNSGQSQVSYIDGRGPGFVTTYIVNGHTTEFATSSTVSGYQVVGRTYDYSLQSNVASIINSHAGYTANGDNLQSAQYVNTPLSDFDFSAKFNQTLSQNIDPATNRVYSMFSINGISKANFEASADYFAISSVPEPETYVMLIAGFGLIGFMASHRKAQA